MVVLNKKDIQRKLCVSRNSLCVIPQKKTKESWKGMMIGSGGGSGQGEGQGMGGAGGRVRCD